MKQGLRWRIVPFLCITVAGFTAACATSTGVIVNPSAPKATYTSAYVVVHGDRSGDMDANLQRELLRHGLGVTAGAEGGDAGKAELIVKYADDWKWDLTMYLRSFDVMVFDAKTKVLLATGSWKNSALHAFYSADKVVGTVVNETFEKLNR